MCMAPICTAYNIEGKIGLLRKKKRGGGEDIVYSISFKTSIIKITGQIVPKIFEKTKKKKRERIIWQATLENVCMHVGSRTRACVCGRCRKKGGE